MQWDLTTLYSNSEEAKKDLSIGLSSLVSFSSHLKNSTLEKACLCLQEAAVLFKQLQSYASCVLAVHPSDQRAGALLAQTGSLGAGVETALFNLGLALSSSENLESLLQKQPHLAYFLKERATFARQGLDSPREELIQALSIDGYHSYWNLYRLVVGKLSVPFEGKQLSMGQADSLLLHPDRSIRNRLAPLYEKAWAQQADLIAQFLNHLSGFRLQVYEQRGWTDLLFEPLRGNRMEKKTLDAMWEAVLQSRPLFLRYFAAKARHLGVEKLSWHDLQAPLGSERGRKGESEGKELISYEEGKERVLRAFKAWHPPLEAFCRSALEKKWVEAENRSGKQAGAFCYFFPKEQESRIFMTYQGTFGCVQTLAHELGHAYHSHCMKGLPHFAQEYRMNLAETASTLAETLVIEELCKNAASSTEKLFLLDHKLQRAAVFFTNLHARFLFELSFYKERQKGFVDKDRLCFLMESAQKEVFQDSLEAYFPLFWASKLHFYLTEDPFYNFPYTFGFTLSQALKKSPQKVDLFLADSASFSSEELVQKHLGIDLRDPKFWRETIGSFSKDVEEFVRL